MEKKSKKCGFCKVTFKYPSTVTAEEIMSNEYEYCFSCRKHNDVVRATSMAIEMHSDTCGMKSREAWAKALNSILLR